MNTPLRKIKTARQEALRRQFLDSSKAKRAIAEFNRRTAPTGAGGLRKLLSHHNDVNLHWTDTYTRYNFDLLLGYISLLEIAHAIDYIDVDEEQRTHLLILENASVRSYYEEHYPLTLPTLYRARLVGLWHAKVRRPSRCHGLFEEFLALYQGFLADDVMWYFLDLLDDYAFAIDLDDLLNALSRRKQVEKLLLKRNLRGEPLAKAAQGFSRFLSFCIRLRGLLDRAASEPLFQSAMWHHYAFWFRQLGAKVRETVTLAVARTSRWSTSGSRQLRGRKANTKNAIRVLVGQHYARAIDKAAKHLL